MKKAFAFIFAALAAVVCGAAPEAGKTSERPPGIACVGDLITEGAKLADPSRDCYPARLQLEPGDDFKICNCGISYRTLQHDGDYPIWKDDLFADAFAMSPGIVPVKPGTDDIRPQSWNRARFGRDAFEIVRRLQNLKNRPRVVIVLPVPAFADDPDGIKGSIIANEVVPIWREVAGEIGAELLDFYTPMPEDAALFPDNIHPNEIGAVKTGRIAARYLAVPRDPGFDLSRKLPRGAVKSDFRNYPVYELESDGRRFKAICPKISDARHSWGGSAQFTGCESQVDLSLLEDGACLLLAECRSSRIGGGLGGPARFRG